jgi:hypothetical protein
MRITVFHGTKNDFVQCVICSDKLDKFKSLGFVESVDKLKDKAKTKSVKNDKKDRSSK